MAGMKYWHYAPKATRPIFQMKAKPRIKPDTTVEQLCTMLLFIGG
jgi:hypothetical protein